MNGIVFDIKRFAVHDGPGIRSTVHLKGCPLSCCWCHNPEGIDPLPQEMEREVRIGDRIKLKNETVGSFFSAAELIDELMKDRLFWEESGGGVTFSGGEPLMQFAFLKELLLGLKKLHIHTAIDTSCFTSLTRLQELAPLCSLFLVDLKGIDDYDHQQFTGVSNQLILANIEWLSQNKHPMRIRIPVIPGKNFNEKEFDALLHFLSDKHFQGVDLLPFHAIASAKYRRFGMKNEMEGSPSLRPEALKEWKKQLEQQGINVTIGG